MGSLINARPPWDSLVAQRLDGAEARRPVRGIETEEQPDADRDAEGHEDRGHRDDRHRQAGDGNRQDAGQSEANQDSEGSAQSGKEHRLDEELHEDVAPSGADRLTDADLASAFRNGDEQLSRVDSVHVSAGSPAVEKLANDDGTDEGCL